MTLPVNPNPAPSEQDKRIAGGHVIAMNRGVTVVDEEDADLEQYSWQAASNPLWSGRVYARTAACNFFTSHPAPMHKIIAQRMGITSECVDHIDGDSLNNRRSNLRGCTRGENVRNAKKRKNASSVYKGVSARSGKFAAQIKVSGKRFHLGTFTDELEAAKAYDAAAKLHFGDFARINFQ